MRILVTGREGQVVCALLERAAVAGVEIIPIGRPDFDLAGPPDRIVSATKAGRPDVIVSAAAYTQVDKAESERELAFAVNAHGPRAIARAAGELGVPLLHLSTDYVFDGTKSSPYSEDDRPNPAGAYGASKLAGEEAVLAENADSVVLRTAWVYSPFASNFVKTMLRLAADREEISVVADQRGNPTCALDIADGILGVAANLRGNPDPALRGIFHMTGASEASWAEFAEAVFAESSRAGGPSARVRHIYAADYPTAARRPANSRLDSGKLERTHGVSLPDWHSSLKEVVTRLVGTGKRSVNR
jgi:dTDP-4-dehydrorhamnose reductase